MLSILPIWAYIFLTVFITGIAVLRTFAGRELPSRILGHFYHVEDICMTGIMTVTVYAQVFSLFGGVGLYANIILVIICLVSAYLIFKGKKYSDLFGLKEIRKNRAFILFVFCAVLLMAYGSSRGYFHYDSDLYHGQAIHWIEDYGVVKGLGNLHGRLAYNSSSFALSALYSFTFLGGMSYHACAGFVALLLFISCARIVHVFKDRKVYLSDFARLAGIYYIGNIYDEMVSPASDYFTMLLFIYIIIRFLDGAEKSADADYYGIYALMSFFVVTVKLSAGPVVLLTILPLAMLISGKRYRKVCAYAGAVLVILLPFLIRNLIISGRLLYPSTALDLFSFDWEIPYESAVSDKAYIVAFGRGFSNMEAADMTFSEWFPTWFASLEKTWKLMFYGGLMGSVFWVLEVIKGINKKEKKAENVIYHFTIFAVVVTFAFWLLSSPLVRYGQGFLITLPLITFGKIFMAMTEETKIKGAEKFLTTLAIGFILLFMIYKGAMTAVYVRDTFRQPYYVQPQDYGRYETHLVTVGNMSVYAPDSGDRTGYYDFPSVPSDTYLPELYDPDDFSKGFK